MEAQTSLVGADSAVELYAVALVYLDFTFVVSPWNLEEDYSFRHNHSFEDFILLVDGVAVENGFQRR